MRALPATVVSIAVFLAPVAAWARPPGAGRSSGVAAALYAGIGGPVCLAAAAMVAACALAALWSRRRGWRLCAGAGGALSVGLALVLARLAGGHDGTTELALAAGVLGLAVPALQAMFNLGAELER